jgi:hypothetical protein
MSKAQLREVVFPLLVKQSLHFIHQHGGEREAPIVSISSMMKHVCPSFFHTYNDIICIEWGKKRVHVFCSTACK